MYHYGFSNLITLRFDVFSESMFQEQTLNLDFWLKKITIVQLSFCSFIVYFALRNEPISNGTQVVVENFARSIDAKSRFFDNAVDLILVIGRVGPFFADNYDWNWVVTFMNAFNHGFWSDSFT